MAGISNYLADKINDWLHGNAVGWTPPATTYLALMLDLPTASGGGTEVTGGSYVRLAVTNNAINWPASVNGIKSNGAILTWATPTADWGDVVGIAEYDASTSGNLLFFSPFSTAELVLDGQPFSLPAQAAVYKWRGGISTYLADQLNDWLHGGGTYTVPSPTYFALMKSGPTTIANDGVDADGTETSGGSYARPSDTNNNTNWPASVAQTKANANTITYPTASTDWTGPEKAVAEFDASSGGHPLTFGDLTTQVTVHSGATPQIAIGGAVYTVQ